MLGEQAAGNALGDLLTEAKTHEDRCKTHTDNYKAWYNIAYRLSSEINAAARNNRNSFSKEYVTNVATLQSALKEIKALADNPKNRPAQRRIWATWCERVTGYLQ